MESFTAWLEPTKSLAQLAKDFGDVFNITLEETDRYDEHPAFEVAFEDGKGKYLTINVVGIPKDIDFLQEKYPEEFTERDRLLSCSLIVNDAFPFACEAYTLKFESINEIELAINSKLKNLGYVFNLKFNRDKSADLK